MRLLLDVNSGASWAPELRDRGIDALHWTTVAAPNDPDAELVRWARDHDCVLLTKDRGIPGRIVRRGAGKPSVIVVRRADVLDGQLLDVVAVASRLHADALETGAIVVLDARAGRARVRRLRCG